MASSSQQTAVKDLLFAQIEQYAETDESFGADVGQREKKLITLFERLIGEGVASVIALFQEIGKKAQSAGLHRGIIPNRKELDRKLDRELVLYLFLYQHFLENAERLVPQEDSCARIVSGIHDSIIMIAAIELVQEGDEALSKSQLDLIMQMVKGRQAH